MLIVRYLPIALALLTVECSHPEPGSGVPAYGVADSMVLSEFEDDYGNRHTAGALRHRPQ